MRIKPRISSVSSRDIAFAANAFQQIAFGNTGGREDVVAARHIRPGAILFTGFTPIALQRASLVVSPNATILFVVAFDVMICASRRPFMSPSNARITAAETTLSGAPPIPPYSTSTSAVWHTGEN